MVTNRADEPRLSESDPETGFKDCEQREHQSTDARHLDKVELPSIKALRIVVTSHHPEQTMHNPVTLPIPVVIDLPPVLDVVTAGRVLDMGRTKAYALARAGKFPCRIIHAGRSFLVPTAELLRLLGLAPQIPGDANPQDIDTEET